VPTIVGLHWLHYHNPYSISSGHTLQPSTQQETVPNVYESGLPVSLTRQPHESGPPVSPTRQPHESGPPVSPTRQPHKSGQTSANGAEKQILLEVDGFNILEGLITLPSCYYVFYVSYPKSGPAAGTLLFLQEVVLMS